MAVKTYTELFFPFNSADQATLDQIVRAGPGAKLYVFPTETVWGVGCPALDAEAVRQLRRVKGSVQRKGWPLVIDSFQRLETWVEPTCLPFFPAFAKLTRKPITFLLPSHHPAGAWLRAEDAKDSALAFRVTEKRLLQALVRTFQSPWVASSANFAAFPPARSKAELDPLFLQQIHILIDEKGVESSLPSSIIRFVEPGLFKLERQGDYSPAEIEHDLPGWRVV